MATVRVCMVGFGQQKAFLICFQGTIATIPLGDKRTSGGRGPGLQAAHLDCLAEQPFGISESGSMGKVTHSSLFSQACFIIFVQCELG